MGRGIICRTNEYTHARFIRKGVNYAPKFMEWKVSRFIGNLCRSEFIGQETWTPTGQLAIEGGEWGGEEEGEWGGLEDTYHNYHRDE